jgi:hypothetical protein
MYSTNVQGSFRGFIDGAQDVEQTVEETRIRRFGIVQFRCAINLVFPPPDVPKIQTNSPRFKLIETPLKAAIPSIPNKYVLCTLSTAKELHVRNPI